MAREIEAKYRLADPAALRAALRSAAAEYRGRVAELNRIFDTADLRLLHAGCGLRVRAESSLDAPATASPFGGSVTFKDRVAVGTLKVRDELETAVADPEALAALFARLGFRETICFEKRRETWRIGEFLVTLDEMPRLGWFAEIEGPDEPGIRELGGRLGLGDESLVSESYVGMAYHHGTADASGRRVLRFG